MKRWRFICSQVLVYEIMNNLPQSKLDSEFTELGRLLNYSLANANSC